MTERRNPKSTEQILLCTTLSTDKPISNALGLKILDPELRVEKAATKFYSYRPSKRGRT
jgi:hypothetical protein